MYLQSLFYSENQTCSTIILIILNKYIIGEFLFGYACTIAVYLWLCHTCISCFEDYDEFFHFCLFVCVLLIYL